MLKIFRMVLLVSLVVASLISSAHYWQSTFGMDQGSQAIRRWETRLAPVQAALPFTRGVIGYVGEWDVPGVEYSYADQHVEYLLAQYALSPLILKKGAAAEWNVAVLGAKSLSIWQAAFGEDFQITPLGRQVYLLHKVERP